MTIANGIPYTAQRDLPGREGSKSVTRWRHLQDPGLPALQAAASALELHPLVISTIQEDQPWPRFEQLGGQFLLTVWDIDRQHAPITAPSTELTIAVGADWIMTVQQTLKGPVRDLSELVDAPGPGEGATAVLHRILEAIIDDFSIVAAGFEVTLEEVEASVFDAEVEEDFEKIYRLRQSIGFIDRAVTGLAEAIQDAESLIVQEEDGTALIPYLRHLHAKATGASNHASAQHAALDAVVASHENNVATRQNKDMRTISAIAALLAVPTVVAGLYGMNFPDLPLIGWTAGWGIVAGAVLVIDLVAYLWFKARRWL